MKRIWLSLFILVLATVQLAAPAGATQTDRADRPISSGDASAHWAAAVLDKWQGYGILQGYANGELKPNRELTRAEFAVLLDRTFSYRDQSSAQFADVTPGAWYAEAVARLRAAGVLAGDGNGRLWPQRPISREEAAKLIAISFGIEPLAEEAESPFGDEAEIAAWSRGYVEALHALGFIQGRADGRFEPKGRLTRAEAVQMMDNIVPTIAGAGSKLPPVVSGGLLVNAAPLLFEDTVMEDDLYLAPGTAGELLQLRGTRVEGTLRAMAGPSGMLEAEQSSLASLLITAPQMRVRLVDSTAELIRVAPQGGESVIDLDEHSRAALVVLDAPARLSGSGEVAELVISSPGVTVARHTGRIVIIEGIEATIAGKSVTGTGQAIMPPASSSSEAGYNGGAGSWMPSAPQPSAERRQAVVDFGDAPSEATHHVMQQGAGGIAQLSTQVGALSDGYTVRYFEGIGAGLSLTISDLPPFKPVTLEIEEIHQRQAGTIAYTIEADGEAVYFRTYNEASEGPNHYFVELDGETVGSDGEVQLTFSGVSDTRVNLNRLWAHSEFEAWLATEGFQEKMTVGLFQPQLAWDDYEADLTVLEGIRARYGGLDMYEIGLGFDIYYMIWSEGEMRQRLDYLLRLSRDVGLPLHLSLNSWWGGTPDGLDGLGGSWKDVTYNQVVYDPLDVDGRGHWKLSTPNIWSNTPWLSMNNAHYNEVRAEKLKAVTRYISELTARMQAAGDTVPPTVVFTENEPLYWPFYAFNPSTDGTGDYGPQVIADAAADGILLDPTDGLSREERIWLADNLTAYIGQVGDAIATGYRYNATVIADGQTMKPSYQLVENAYTHMFPTPIFPLRDERRSAWEAHMVEPIRFGGEWEGHLDDRYLDYIAARGRFADVNAERGSMLDFAVLGQAYAYGADHVTIYNYRPGDEVLVQEQDGQQDERYVRPAHETLLHSYTFDDASSLTPGGLLVEAVGVRRGPLNEHQVLSPDNGSAAGGYVTFRVDRGGAPLSHGLTLQLSGRSLTHLNSGSRIEVWAGSALDELELVQTLRDFHAETIDLGEAIDRSSDVAYIRVRLYAVSLPDELLDWSAIDAVQIYEPWSMRPGAADGREYSYDEMRERYLWITRRADIERMLTRFQQQASEPTQMTKYTEMKKLYEQGRYKSAYEALTAAMSELLPAKFVVRGAGTLGDYPLQLDSGDPGVTVQATLLQASGTYRLSLQSETDMEVELSVLQPVASHYKARAVEPGGSIYEISPAQAGESGAMPVIDGRVSFTLTAVAAYAKNYPDILEARLYKKGSGEQEGYIRIQSHDPAIGEYVNSIQLKLAETLTVRRGPAGAPSGEMLKVPLSLLEHGDLVRLELNAQDEIVSIEACYGRITGTVTAVEPISIRGQLSNAFVELQDDGGASHRFELGAETKLAVASATGMSIYTADVEDLGIEVGDRLSVHYSPYTFPGRAPRALSLYETYDALVEETFEDADESWRARAHSVTNLSAVSLDGNYRDKVLRPEQSAAPGEIVWRIERDSPSEQLIVEYSGRAIMGNPAQQRVAWYVSGDQATWTEVGQIEPGANEGNFTLSRTIDVTEQTAGWSVVYIKSELRTTVADTWASLNDVVIKRRAPQRSLATATLELDEPTVLQGQLLPLRIHASYDNNEPVALAEHAEIAYTVGIDGVLEWTAEGIRAARPGTATIVAYVRVDGRIVATAPLEVEVIGITPASVVLSLREDILGSDGEMTQASVRVYNDAQVELDPGLFEIRYTSSDEQTASVSTAGVVTGHAPGQAVIGVQVALGDQLLQQTAQLTVARRQMLLDESFESYGAGQIDFTELGAYEVYRLQVEPMDEPTFPQLGLSGLFDGQDAGWQGKHDGYVIYRADSSDPAGFRRLSLAYSGRTVGVGDWQGALRFYAGAAPDQLSFVGELGGDDAGDVTKLRTLDLSAVAQGLSTIYVKIEIQPDRYTWAFLDRLRLTEYTTSTESLATSTLLAENFASGDDWMDATASYEGLSVRPVDAQARPEPSLAPTNGSGRLVYTLDSLDPDGFRQLRLAMTGRAIMGSTIRIAVAVDGEPSVLVAMVDESSGAFLDRPLHIDLTDAALGASQAQLILEFNSGYDTWASITGLLVQETHTAS
ncbi:hypothetical protein PA598K_03567 [Paenibacillus sp. 598K]|uniref:S-layer homology domain-containing protein n=1 Tax=Paenibacillus sp. 598K TaxID=1117987 RepID=UPI000FFB05DA|nr:S-layer homology domain-containing protein [Paenibacillus sp. 598K]GBF75181.1 hypothetical protein PA598K_03567 [Paenibacillus sp. 598K]